MDSPIENLWRHAESDNLWPVPPSVLWTHESGFEHKKSSYNDNPAESDIMSPVPPGALAGRLGNTQASYVKSRSWKMDDTPTFIIETCYYKAWANGDTPLTQTSVYSNIEKLWRHAERDNLWPVPPAAPAGRRGNTQRTWNQILSSYDENPIGENS